MAKTTTRTKDAIVARIEIPHAAACSAVRQVRLGNWDTPWGPISREAPSVWLDSLGRKPARGGSRLWYRFDCNASDCPARMLVSYNAIVMMAEDALSASLERSGKMENDQ